MMIEQPMRYYVQYEDPELRAKVIERDGDLEDSDPGEYWRTKDFAYATDALAFRDAQPLGAIAFKRTNLRFDNPYWTWDDEVID